MTPVHRAFSLRLVISSGSTTQLAGGLGEAYSKRLGASLGATCPREITKMAYAQ